MSLLVRTNEARLAMNKKCDWENSVHLVHAVPSYRTCEQQDDGSNFSLNNEPSYVLTFTILNKSSD